MMTTDIQKIALVAGEGQLPLEVARNAIEQGIEVIPFAISRDNLDALKKICQTKPQLITPGLVETNLALFRQASVEHIVFAGKVNKWILLRNPKLDRRAVDALKHMATLADDDVMRWIVDELAREGLTVLEQTRFLQTLFQPPGLLSQSSPTEREQQDIAYGFHIAKEMGRLDIGQTVVVKNGMIIAIEAIEGTDYCLKRAGDLTRKKGGVVIKVAKPEQDQRFDVPTVGLRTLKTMRKAGLRVLATEANQTLFLELEAMAAYANQYDMSIVSVEKTSTFNSQTVSPAAHV